MHSTSGRRFSVVVKQSSGLVVQSPGIHYGMECVYRQDIDLCRNAALYYLPKETPPKKTIELLSHTFFVLSIWKKCCSGTSLLTGLCGAVLGQPGTALPQSAALYCLSISRSIHYSSAPLPPALHHSCLRALQLPVLPLLSSRPLFSPLTSHTYL